MWISSEDGGLFIDPIEQLFHGMFFFLQLFPQIQCHDLKLTQSASTSRTWVHELAENILVETEWQEEEEKQKCIEMFEATFPSVSVLLVFCV